jgi:hypothetical protein
MCHIRYGDKVGGKRLRRNMLRDLCDPCAGWALLHSSPSGAGGNANERGKGSIDIADAVLMTVSSVNNHYRRASSVLTSVPEGDRFCRRSSQEQHPIAVQCQPARSFSSNAEAVPLGTVPMLAPEPLMALQGTSGGAHPASTMPMSLCLSQQLVASVFQLRCGLGL